MSLVRDVIELRPATFQLIFSLSSVEIGETPWSSSAVSKDNFLKILTEDETEISSSKLYRFTQHHKHSRSEKGIQKNSVTGFTQRFVYGRTS